MSKSGPEQAGQSSSAKGADAGRRLWLYGAVAGVATLAGLGLSRWKKMRDGEPVSTIPGLWELVFDVPGKPALQLKKFAGRPLLLNFWATWCPPCVEEFPLLDRFYKENMANGWQVLGLAADNPAAVASFLQRLPVQFPIALAGMAGIDLSKTMGNVGGGLPYTIVLGSTGNVLERKIGRVSVEDLARWSALR